MFYDELAKIPSSKDLYISGIRALNVIDLKHSTDDWHRVEAWEHPEAELKPSHIMGNQPPAQMNTHPYLGDLGIFEVSAVLKKMGIPKFSDAVYCATHARAIADRVIAEAFLATPFKEKTLFRFIDLYDLDDFMPSETDKQRVYDLLEIAIPKLPAKQSAHVAQ